MFPLMVTSANAPETAAKAATATRVIIGIVLTAHKNNI